MIKRTLYDVTEDVNALLEMMDDPDMDQQTIFDTLEGLAYEFDLKSANIARIIDELNSMAEVRKTKAARLMELARNDVNRADRLKEYLCDMMVKTGRTKFNVEDNGDTFGFSIRNADRVIIDNPYPENYPEKFLTIKQPEISKTKLKAAIKAGDPEVGELAHIEKHASVVIK